MIMQTCIGCAVISTEAEYNTLFAWLNLVKTGSQPNKQQDYDSPFDFEVKITVIALAVNNLFKIHDLWFGSRIFCGSPRIKVITAAPRAFIFCHIFIPLSVYFVVLVQYIIYMISKNNY